MTRWLIFPVFISFVHISCSTKIVSNNYYQEHKGTVDSIERRYEKLNPVNPFSLAYTDKKFNIVSMEMIA